MSAPQSDLAFLVAGVVLGALEDDACLRALPLRAVPELVAGVVTGRIVLEDAAGRRRLVVEVGDVDAEPGGHA
jgi:hypothetical protein